MAAAGTVSTHAHKIWFTTGIFIALNRFEQPTPMMLAVIACVVETGIPYAAATVSTVAPVVSAAKP